MRILAVDIGTGTQDIFLFDSRLDLENGFKLVLPSPTMMMRQRIRAATERRSPIVLTGHQMGGGPSAWAAEAHVRAGLPVFATPEAALTLDDDLDRVSALGIQIVSEDEARQLKAAVLRLEFRDFDFAGDFRGIRPLRRGAAAISTPSPLRCLITARRLPGRLTGNSALIIWTVASAREIRSQPSRIFPVRFRRACHVCRPSPPRPAGLDCPLVVMDTAPAAILGATFDPVVAGRGRSLIANVGNFHALAFRLGPEGIEGLFEHHTGEIDLPKLETLLRALAAGTLRHADVFNDMGHGALIYDSQPLELGTGPFDVVVTGPRRSMFGRGRRDRQMAAR